uniref:Reverse transcriptase domain-containing protein n=1 Tax=Tanacetum cinerariifolium TaxID=118510 RepID=A0A6L2M3V3_TANCI|nr:reverse transcriptase domain-containing protein [Tanacetum cinerariifolium]
MEDTRTKSELFQAPTEGYGDAIVLPPILAENFKLKVGLLQLVTLSQFHGFERDDPHAHIRWFNKITSTLKYRNVSNEAIKLMLFLSSLDGATRIWLEKEPPRSILIWEDIQIFNESFGEAWDRFKDLLHKCPHHGFLELHQIDTFYNALTKSNQVSLNAAAGGNLLNRTPRDALTIIKNKSKVRISRNKPIVSKVNTTTSSPSPSLNVTTLTEIVTELVLMNKATQHATIKAIEETCVTCGGPHPYYECLAIVATLLMLVQPGVAYKGSSIPRTSSPLPKDVEREPEAKEDKVQSTSSENALLHMPKFASTFKSLLSNKEKLFELASTSLNENCSATLLKKLLEKLRDPDKFLIPCEFSELEECLALADLGASINLMPLSVWKKLSLSELNPTHMTLELVNRLVAYPAITFKVRHTSRYFRNYYEESVNQINVIDVACEEYAQEVLGFSNSSTSGNLTPSDPIIATSSPSFTPFEGSDFILEEIETFLRTSNELSNLDDGYYDTEGDILYLEKLLNEDPSLNLPPMKNEDLEQVDVTMTKPSIEELPKLELKDLPSHLEYAFLEGTDKLPVIISNEIKDEENATLLKVLKSHKRDIA